LFLRLSCFENQRDRENDYFGKPCWNDYKKV